MQTKSGQATVRRKKAPRRQEGSKTMQYEVTLPSLGDDLEDVARVSMWLADEGDIVNENDDLVEMVTDKAAFTIPSPKSGTLIEKLVDEEDEVKVGDEICILEI